MATDPAETEEVDDVDDVEDADETLLTLLETLEREEGVLLETELEALEPDDGELTELLSEEGEDEEADDGVLALLAEDGLLATLLREDELDERRELELLEGADDGALDRLELLTELWLPGVADEEEDDVCMLLVLETEDALLPMLEREEVAPPVSPVR